jgi:hypothetical protein
LSTQGLSASIGEDEANVLWRKLALLAPIALATTLRGSTLDEVVADPAWPHGSDGASRRW